MEDFLFYLSLGIHHVLDWNAYDHMLFLSAMALPFSFKNNQHLLFLVTAFTVTHCTSLALSVYHLVEVNTQVIEFLIPLSILVMVVFNALFIHKKEALAQMRIHLIATALFGFIHGFGFSNYFKMLIGESEEKASGLISFALGLEGAQLIIISVILTLGYLLVSLIGLSQKKYVVFGSLLVGILTLPLLVNTFWALIGS